MRHHQAIGVGGAERMNFAMFNIICISSKKPYSSTTLEMPSRYVARVRVTVAVFGCADLLLTDDNAMVTRLGDTAVIRCSDPDEVFVLTCTGGQWIGTQQANCSTGSSRVCVQ